MKKLLSVLLAAALLLTGFVFPVAAEEVSDVTVFSLEDISVTGGTADYDAYLNAVRIVPAAAGESVTVSYTTENEKTAIWVPATSFSTDSISADVVINGESSVWSINVGHKFALYGGMGEGSVSFTYVPETAVSYVYFYGTGNDWTTLGEAANGSLNGYGEDYLDLSEYDVDRYTKYYWDNDIVFNESFMVIKEEDGTIAPNEMMYEIDRVVSVKNSYLNREYVYGVDYLIEDGKLVIPEGSAITQYPYDTVYKNSNTSGSYWETLDGRFVYAGQYNMYFVGYFNITYTVKDTWNGVVPESKGIYLNRVSEKLNTPGETVKVLGIGDSLAGGANVSADIGETGVAPYAERWCDMVRSGLQLQYPDVTVENLTIAQGGATATLAIERMDEIVAYSPDLLIIEFGTNECMAGTDASVYIDTLRQAIDAVNEKLPDCDIMLVTPIISNPLIFPIEWFYAYSSAIYELEREGVAVADVTSVYQYALTRKDYIDMTGDFLCHPNDFGNRIFVQTMLKTVEAGTEEAYIAGLADRITHFKYENEYDAPDWEKIEGLVAAAQPDIADSATAAEALEAFIAHATLIDEVPTSAENISNSALDVSKIIYNSPKPLEMVSANNNTVSKYNDVEKALEIVVTNGRNPSVTLDYTKGDFIVSADGYDYAVFTMKAPLTNGSRAKASKLTFTTDGGTTSAITVNLILDGEYHSYIVDLSGEAGWSGNIQSLKLQAFSSANVDDQLFVSSIVLASDMDSANDAAVEYERLAKGDAQEPVTYLMSDDATSAILKAPGGEKYLAGDVNGDERVNAVDSLLIRHYLVDASTKIDNPVALDADASGEVDVADALLIRKVLAGVIKASVVDLSDASVSYSSTEKAAKIVLGKDNATVTADLSGSGLTADMFKYVTVCAKRANGEALDVLVTLTYTDGVSEQTVSVPADVLFNADIAKFVKASGEILSISFTFNANAGETVYLDSFVFAATLSAAENAVAVRVGAANLFS